MKMRVQRNATGFTLIEMAVVMIIIAILAATAGYTYYSQIQRMRLSADVRKVDQALQQAKMRAVASGIPCGVVFWRRGGNDRTKTPDEIWVFMDSVRDNSYTDDDLPCTGCREDGTPISCPKVSKPNCRDSATVGTDYTDTHDLIVDGPYALETGDYFARILGSKNPTSGGVAEFAAAGYEFILFDPLGGVSSPRLLTTAVDSRRIYLQNHPRQRAGSMAEQAAIEVTFATGITRTIPRGQVAKDAWRQ